MMPSELAERFEEAQSSKSRISLLGQVPCPDGFNERIFSRVVQLAGVDPGRAKLIAKDWRVLLQKGDSPAYAYRLRAIYERLEGKWQASAKSFKTAAKLSGNPSFETGAIDSLARAGDIEGAVRLGRRLAKKLSSLGDALGAARACLNLGNAYLWADDHKKAAESYAAAVNYYGPDSRHYEAAIAKLGQSTTSLMAAPAAIAYEMASQAHLLFADLGMRHYADLCTINKANSLVRMGRADEAVRLLSDVRENLENDSVDRARLEEFLADAFLELRLTRDAQRNYEFALSLPGIRASNLNRANCILGQAESLLLEQQYAGALAAAHRAKLAYSRAGNRPYSVWAQVLENRAKLALGRTRGVLPFLRLAAEFFRSTEMNRFEAEVLLDSVPLLKSRQEIEEVLNEAEKIIKSGGYLALEWRVHALRAQNRSESEALNSYRRMMDSILKHQLALTSLTAKTSFLADKQDAVRKCLSLMIATAQGAAEAANTISVLRSATLIDEIRMAGTSTHRPHGPALDRLRVELEAATNQEIKGGPLRQVFSAKPRKSTVAEALIETFGFEKIPSAPAAAGSQSADCSIFAFLDKGAMWLQNNEVVRLDVDRDEIARALRWIQFDLFSPLSGLNSDVENLSSELAALGSSLKVDMLQSSEGVVRICPEDAAFQVPWPLLREDVEPLLVFRPGLGADPHKLKLPANPKVAIWHHRRPELPYIKKEVDAIRRKFPQAVLCETSEEVLNSAAHGPFDVIHVAAHGVYCQDNPMFSSIELADGHLLACDIAKSGIRTSLATLSSCDSSTIGSVGGFEPHGLSRAFLTCGAEIVVGSLWPLDDKIAHLSFGEFYRCLSRGRSVYESVKSARKSAKNADSHPMYWGPLVMIGGYKE